MAVSGILHNPASYGRRMAYCRARKLQGYRNVLWSYIETGAANEAGASSMTTGGRRSVGGETRRRPGLVGMASTVLQVRADDSICLGEVIP